MPKHAYGDGYGAAPIGSGPYKFVSWTKGQQMIAEPNPHYYGAKPAFERITFLFTKEDATLAAARMGQVHVAAVPNAFASSVPANMRKVVVKTVDNRGIMFPMRPSGGKTPEGYDLGNNVTADPAIRKAINMAISRKALVSGVLGGYGTPAWGPADGLPWDNPKHRLPDGDVQGAKALLKQAGWVANSQGVLEKNGVQARIPLLYFSDDTTRQGLALAVADMVKPLGIVLEVSGKTREEVKRLKHSSTVLYGWGAHSPQEVYNLYSGSKAGKGSYNAGYYNNPTVNAELGFLAVGQWQQLLFPRSTIGGTDSADVTPKSYAYYESNSDGTYKRIAGRVAKLISASVLIDASEAPRVERLLEKIIDIPVAIEASSLPRYGHLSTVGFVSGSVRTTSDWQTARVDIKVTGNI